MNIQSVLAAGRSEVVRLLKSILRLLQWIVVFFIIVFIGMPIVASIPPFGKMPAEISGIQAVVVSVVMVASLSAIVGLLKSQIPGRIAWVGVHTGIFAVAAASLSLLPQWSGPITAATFALFVFTPYVLNALASRTIIAGHARAAASYARLTLLFHPFRQSRFYSSLMSAHALRSIEGKVAAYRSLALQATPDEFSLLNCFIPMAQDDWAAVLGQVRSGGATSAMKRFEIRALGELGSIEEMIANFAYASAELTLRSHDLLLCRLYVLAFSGRVDGVRSLLTRELRFLSPRGKAYYTFIACKAAGTLDEETRSRLESAVQADDDETFRKSARRHLDAATTTTP